jgi:hypothetical protein
VRSSERELPLDELAFEPEEEPLEEAPLDWTPPELGEWCRAPADEEDDPPSRRRALSAYAGATRNPARASASNRTLMSPSCFRGLPYLLK